MIVFEPAAANARAGESLVAGRRLAGRLFPYGSDAGQAPFRFDPVDRRFVFRRPDATVPVGPPAAASWIEALARMPSGPVLVGPCGPAESVRGAFAAAVRAAVESGRPAYLLDPEPAAIPEDVGARAVALCSWQPGRLESAFPGLAPARAAGLAAAALFPFLPGWTGEPEAVEALVAAARAGGAASITAVAPAADGEGRRSIVEARSSVDPDGGDRFFEIVHHGDWSERMSERLAGVQAAAARQGLASLPPRPLGRPDRAGNAVAAARLEEMADRLEADEHRAALLHAAVRWIDDSGRDLSAISREGNFLRIFPFSGEVAAQAEAALREAAVLR
jgi:hypothetical protein